MNRYGTHWGWLTVVLGLIVGPAQSQELGSESSQSFAEAFFVSTRTLANGEQGVEWLGTGIIWLLLSAIPAVRPWDRTAILEDAPSGRRAGWRTAVGEFRAFPVPPIGLKAVLRRVWIAPATPRRNVPRIPP